MHSVLSNIVSRRFPKELGQATAAPTGLPFTLRVLRRQDMLREAKPLSGELISIQNRSEENNMTNPNIYMLITVFGSTETPNPDFCFEKEMCSC
jgi:hypothetical protein